MNKDKVIEDILKRVNCWNENIINLGNEIGRLQKLIDDCNCYIKSQQDETDRLEDQYYALSNRLNDQTKRMELESELIKTRSMIATHADRYAKRT